MELIGYTGAFLLAICAVPQAMSSIFRGNSDGLSRSFIWSWFIGEILMLYFVVETMGYYGPLYYNYLVNTLLLAIIVYYSHFPRRR